MVEAAIVVQVEEVELPPSEPSLRLGGLGESAEANNCVKDALGAAGGNCEAAGTTRRGLGPGFRRAKTSSCMCKKAKKIKQKRF